MIVYENLLERLADQGWTTYRLQKEHQLGNGTISRLKAGLSVSTDTIDTVCRLCRCQPGDVLRYVDNKDAGEGK